MINKVLDKDGTQQILNNIYNDIINVFENLETDLESENTTGILPVEKGGTGNATGDAVCLKRHNLGSFDNKTIGEFKQSIIDFIGQYDRKFAIAIFSANPNFINNWDNDEFTMLAGQTWQITPIGDMSDFYGNFIISSYFNAGIYCFKVTKKTIGHLEKIIMSTEIL